MRHNLADIYELVKKTNHGPLRKKLYIGKDTAYLIKENRSLFTKNNIFKLFLIVFCAIALIGYVLDIKPVSNTFLLLIISMGTINFKKFNLNS